MATAKANPLPHLVHYVIRPTLVEAKLMTEKHARDAVYVATLTEELRNIELKIGNGRDDADGLSYGLEPARSWPCSQGVVGRRLDSREVQRIGSTPPPHREIVEATVSRRKWAGGVWRPRRKARERRFVSRC